ncbi:MAG: site-specific DNA-methyltransferase [Cellvibrionales bacterium]|nr:site-specific DNA-methyltransferase [Cellvibrionales bacterium]
MTNLPPKHQNRLIQGDVMDTLRALPDGCVDMIFGDPDYGVGIDYGGHTYRKVDKWQQYLDWYRALTTESMRVLSDRGNLFMLNYPRQNAHLWATCLDTLAHDVQEYVWVYPTNVGHSKRRFTTAHRSILHATKSPDNKFYKDQVAQPYKNPTDPRIRQRIRAGHKGRMPYSWFEFNLVKNVARDKTVHACQIPIALFDLLMQAATQPSDSIFILFGGSGSEVIHARNQGRTFLSCEMHQGYHQMIEKRLAHATGAIPQGYRLRDLIENHAPEAVQEVRTQVLAAGQASPAGLATAPQKLL